MSFGGHAGIRAWRPLATISQRQKIHPSALNNAAPSASCSADPLSHGDSTPATTALLTRPVNACNDEALPRWRGYMSRMASVRIGNTSAIPNEFSASLVQLFTFSILLSTAATLLPYVVSSAAWLRTGERKGRWVAAIALLYSLYALVGTGVESLLWGGALVLAGLPVLAFMRRAARRA